MRVHIGVFVEQDITHMHKFDPEPTLMFRLSIRLGVGSFLLRPSFVSDRRRYTLLPNQAVLFRGTAFYITAFKLVSTITIIQSHGYNLVDATVAAAGPGEECWSDCPVLTHASCVSVSGAGDGRDVSVLGPVQRSHQQALIQLTIKDT